MFSKANITSELCVPLYLNRTCVVHVVSFYCGFFLKKKKKKKLLRLPAKALLTMFLICCVENHFKTMPASLFWAFQLFKSEASEFPSTPWAFLRTPRECLHPR